MSSKVEESDENDDDDDDEKKKTANNNNNKNNKRDEKKDTTGSIFESAKSMFTSFVHSTPVEAVEEKGEELEEDAEEKAAEALTLDFEGNVVAIVRAKR